MTNIACKTQAEDNAISRLIFADLRDFSDGELLEILLESHVNREYSRTLARICTRRFGSLANIIKASPYALGQAGLPWQVILAFKFIDAVNERLNGNFAQNILDADQTNIGGVGRFRGADHGDLH